LTHFVQEDYYEERSKEFKAGNRKSQDAAQLRQEIDPLEVVSGSDLLLELKIQIDNQLRGSIVAFERQATCPIDIRVG